MSLKIKEPNNPKSYYTDFGKRCNEMMNQYPTLCNYWDDKGGLAHMTVDEYNSNEKLRDEVFELLKIPDFDGPDGTKYLYNWVMEVRPVWDEATDDMVDGLIIRAVESYQ